MATDRPAPTRASESEKTSPEAQPSADAAKSSSGFKSWLPLVANVLLMPVVAYFTTTLVLIPKLSSGQPSHEAGETAASHGEGGPSSGKNKFNVPLTGKVLVNISGTGGTRYLLANLSLVGAHPNLRELVEKNEAELKDVAAGVLATKTIADLEKPGARNLIRSELISVFNNVLGEGAVAELFLTEFAIQ